MLKISFPPPPKKIIGRFHPYWHFVVLQLELLRERLDEKDQLLDKKGKQLLNVQSDKKKIETDLAELRDHMDIKERKINVLQRKVCAHVYHMFMIALFYASIKVKLEDPPLHYQALQGISDKRAVVRISILLTHFVIRIPSLNVIFIPSLLSELCQKLTSICQNPLRHLCSDS